MIDTYVLLAVLGICIATFVARSSVLLLGSALQLPPALEAALRFAPACALAAIIVPSLIYADGSPDWTWHNHRWVAGLAGVAIFATFRSTIGTIVGGMCAFWLLRLLT
jgi:branched-subunit amino acid transport protein